MGRNNPHIIGLTGSFGSGCSYIAQEILGKRGYRVTSLSDELKTIYQEKTGKISLDCTKAELQNFGDELREEHGTNYLAKRICDRIEEEYKNDNTIRWAVDSIRNPGEVRELREFSTRFFLMGVNADKEIRWERVKDKSYNGDRNEFETNDSNDTGEYNEKYGQRVADTFYESDIVVTNNMHIDAPGSAVFDEFAGPIKKYIEFTEEPLSKKTPIKASEALMAMAYSASQRSSCLKRKVGAIIADEHGNVISSGFNEVPADDKPCNDKYKMCYREYWRERFSKMLEEETKVTEADRDRISEWARTELKMLDRCRALHAEENAILNLARKGWAGSLNTCTLYTTTYPCKMCAHKIVAIGLKEIIYLEPYPDEESKKIIEASDTIETFFVGITYRSYFRIYGEEK